MAKAQIREAWSGADRAQRGQLLRALQVCTRQPDLAKELEFVGAQTRDAFLSRLAAEDAMEQRRITAQIDAEHAQQDLRSQCESSCMSLFGESAARTGQDATACDTLCGGEPNCRRACESAGTSCFASCGER